MKGIKIIGTGRGVPSKLVTNADMAKIVETNDEWITTRTGIHTRHHLADGETITDMTVLAARRPWKTPASRRRTSAPASWPR